MSEGSHLGTQERKRKREIQTEGDKDREHKRHKLLKEGVQRGEEKKTKMKVTSQKEIKGKDNSLRDEH